MKLVTFYTDYGDLPLTDGSLQWTITQSVPTDPSLPVLDTNTTVKWVLNVGTPQDSSYLEDTTESSWHETIKPLP